MKRKNLLVLSACLLLAPVIISCGENYIETENNEKPGENQNPEAKPDEGEDNKDPEVKPDPEKPVDPEVKPDPENPDSGETKPDGGEDNKDPEVKPDPEKPDSGETKPDNQAKSTSIKEAFEACSLIKRSYTSNFNLTVSYKIKGTVLTDYAISGKHHFIVFSDGDEVLPILIPANKDTIKKYIVGNTYEVVGNPGNYRNVNCLNVTKEPIRCEKEIVDLTKITKKSSISDVYDKAYSIEAHDNDSGLDANLYSFEATYVEKINSNLFMVFDGLKHIVVHGDNYVNNGFSINHVYEFTVMPSVNSGKRGCEFISKKTTTKVNETVLNDIKAAAVLTDITSLSQTNRYYDDKKAYPFIFKAEAYIKAMIKGGNYHFCFVDDLTINVKYAKKENERPKTIYIKNHVVDDYSAKYSDLTPYFNNKIKGEFYFYITEYQPDYHVFHAQAINGLINKIQTQN